jgi:hypothetical protein
MGLVMADKPFLAAACLCEKVLQEQDGVLTIVRVVDMFSVAIPSNLPPDTKPGILLSGLLSFKRSSSGAEGETHQARLTLRSPSGKVKILPVIDFFFKPEEVAGANVILQIHLGVEEYGLFWLDVAVDDAGTVTQIPFRLLPAVVSPPATIH